MKLIIGQLKPFALPCFLSVAAMTLSALAELGLPYFLAEIINNGLYLGDVDFVIRTGLLMLLLAVASIACLVINSFFAATVSSGVGKNLRMQIFSKVEGLSLAETDHFGISTLITRSTNDVTQVQNFVLMLIRMVLRAPLMAIGGLMLAFSKSAKLSQVLLISLPVLFLLVTFIAKKGIPISIELQKKLDKVTVVMREKLTGVRVIRAFDNEAYEQRRFDAASRDLTGTAIKMHRTMSLIFPAANLVMSSTIFAMIYFGAHLVASSEILVGDVIGMVQYVMQILMSVIMLSMAFIMMPRALASCARINEVLDIDEVITDPEKPASGEKRGFVSFENVTFIYPNADEPALENISFETGPGEITAVIGSTGSGKSTLLKLILRFYDVTEGKILVDGVDLRDYSQSELRKKLGYVPQRASLFSGTIEENLRYADDNVDKQTLIEAVKTAQAGEFVLEQKAGLSYELEQGGANLSGGQKQRISIARAIARDPEIYLFDDSFSALDYSTDARLRKELAAKTKNAAVIIVAQRISTIINADRIIVLDGGRVAGEGSHRELLKSCEVYREIVSSQLSREEIENGGK